MALLISVQDADSYIEQNVIDVEDWQDSEAERKTRLLNVANRTLVRKFKGLIVPPEAVYEFVAYLAVVFNDTNKMQRYGIKQFSIETTSYTFEGLKDDISLLIPPSVYDLVNEINGGVDFNPSRRIGRSVR